MDSYDPNRAPNPQAWQALDDDQRRELVEAYHRRAGIALPNARVHAMFHVIVEDQLLADDPPEVRRALTRLGKQGLDRHEALHAIGSALAGQMWDATHGASGDLGRAYARAVKKLTARAWLQEKEG
jgi:hypothetical protein